MRLFSSTEVWLLGRMVNNTELNNCECLLAMDECATVTDANPLGQMTMSLVGHKVSRPNRGPGGDQHTLTGALFINGWRKRDGLGKASG